MRSQEVDAVYEGGVLRPLAPLSLPEHARVRIEILVSSEALPHDRERAEHALREAGLSPSVEDAGPELEDVPEDDLRAVGRRLAAAGPLTDLILSERQGR